MKWIMSLLQLRLYRQMKASFHLEMIPLLEEFEKHERKQEAPGVVFCVHFPSVKEVSSQLYKLTSCHCHLVNKVV